MSLSGSRDRIKEAPWYQPDQTVTVGGLGSIGSWLVFMLGRIINTIYVYDFDTVEEHNLTGQLFSKGNIGNSKAMATSSVAMEFNPNTSIIGRGKFEEGSAVTDICFAGFDNMKARRDMFDSWKKRESRELFVDGRLTAEQLWVYAVTPDREDEYEKNYLPTDDQVEELPCSFKSTTHISSMIASIMVIMFTNYRDYKEDLREMPFETKFIAPLMLFETKQK